MAQKLALPADSLKNDIARRRRREDRERQKKETRELMLKTGGVGDKLNPDRLKNARAAGAENAILGILLCYPELLKTAMTGDTPLTADDFCTELNRRVFTCLLQCVQDGGEIAVGALNQYLTPDEMGYITGLKLSREELTTNNAQVLTDCIRTLKSSKSKDLEEILNVKRRKSAAGNNADRG